MGQSTSQEDDGISALFSHLILEEPIYNLFFDEINTLTYERLLALLKELNELSKKCPDADGKHLLFAVKKGTDCTVFWKATVQIACIKMNTATQKLESYRFLNLVEFLKVFKTLQCQKSAAEQSKSDEAYKKLVLKTLDSTESSNECCICFERNQEMILPCAHSFCSQCIEEWNENHDTCPICREKLESTDDTWVLSEVPKAEEIQKEIHSNLMELTDERSNCKPS